MAPEALTVYVYSVLRIIWHEEVVVVGLRGGMEEKKNLSVGRIDCVSNPIIIVSYEYRT